MADEQVKQVDPRTLMGAAISCCCQALDGATYDQAATVIGSLINIYGIRVQILPVATEPPSE